MAASSRYSETLVNSLSHLGRIVREQRRASGLRIDDAAALCGVSVDLLSRLENGHSGLEGLLSKEEVILSAHGQSQA